MDCLVLKGEPETFRAFSAHVTQSESEIKFTELKTKLQSFKDTEEMCVMEQENTDHKLLTNIDYHYRFMCSVPEGTEVTISV